MSRTTNNQRKKRNRRRGRPRRPLFRISETWLNGPAVKLLIKELEAMPPPPPGVMEAYNYMWRIMGLETATRKDQS